MASVCHGKEAVMGSMLRYVIPGVGVGVRERGVL